MRRIILRTDAGEVLGQFRTTHEAREFAASLDGSLSLVIATRDGVVLLRRFPA